MSAPYFLTISGNFVIQGYEPDGDSVRFIADNLGHYKLLKNSYKIKPSKRDGSVQLRFDGIDAPELHYGTAAQPMGKESRDALLARMGFTDIGYDPHNPNKMVSSTPDAVPGIILSAAAEANGRPVSYVLLAGEAPGQNLTDGEWTYVPTDLLDQTINVWSLNEGWSYYTAYTSAPYRHRQHLQSLAQTARSNGKGVWDLDTTAEFELVNQDSIGPQGQLILPKLFRRGTDYLKDVINKGFNGNLTDWIVEISKLPSRNENDGILINDRVTTKLSDLLEQRNKYVAFTADLLEITFIEKV